MKIKSTLWKDLSVSRVTLGTVQLGMKYGIANHTGKPKYDEARAIIKNAYEQGITTFDTAANYGESEEILGRAAAELGILDHISIITKVKVPPELPQDEARSFIETSILRSLKRLGLKRLPLLLFHSELNRNLFDMLKEFKKKGLIAHIGISVITPNTALEIIQEEKTEAVQIPVNLLERRFNLAIDEASSRNIAVFGRSAFLQGLILLKDEEIPDYLREVIPALEIVRHIAMEQKISIQELALRYTLSLPGITSLVVGAETVQQVIENACYAKKGPLDKETIYTLQHRIPQLSETIVSPPLWESRKKRVVEKTHNDKGKI
jgi:aryl-alcohol dehydrogenase-like predicted oxidoreductase